jgi:hypothetical protein
MQSSEENPQKIREVEQEIAEAVKKVKAAGLSTEEINKRGDDRLPEAAHLVDPEPGAPAHPL